MRFPEPKIKEAILHHEPAIRARAARYFSDSFFPDTSVMPLVIKAVETYGRQDAELLVGCSAYLAQTEESVTWVIDELNRERGDAYDGYTHDLSRILLEAEPSLLLPRESAVLGSAHFRPQSREAFTERLRMQSWDEARCWRELDAFCEANEDKETLGEVNLDHANRIVEVLRRRGTQCEEKVHALLRPAAAFHDGPDALIWMEPLLARLAGEARIESAVPLLVVKLLEDGGDVLNQECARSLARIGTPAVLHAVAGAFPGSPRHFPYYAIGPLERIHSDLAVETCVDLFAREQDDDTRLHLAYALLSQFAPEGIEAARTLLLGGRLDFERKGLRSYLLQTCILTGERFPGFDEWLAADKADRETHRRKLEEIGDDPTRMLLFALESLASKPVPGLSEAKRALLPKPAAPLGGKPGTKPKVGRNDRCPCGSGKKYKACCGRA